MQIITSHIHDISLNLVLEKLESQIHDLFRWFEESYMKANPDKCPLLVTNNPLTSVNVNSVQITNSTEQKLSSIVNSLLKTMSQ